MYDNNITQNGTGSLIMLLQNAIPHLGDAILKLEQLNWTTVLLNLSKPIDKSLPVNYIQSCWAVT